ncbi:MAG: MarR family winged helix-turn-helix transcriptional regulator [Blautia sp.]|jgi:DNA-binding MarR family transcriptional regulator
MKKARISEIFVQNLLLALPNWHTKLVRPFKESLHGEMSLETYYCLETLRMSGAITMTELAQKLKVPKQQVAKLIGTLSEHRFIDRIASEEDKRMIYLQPTPQAVEYLDQYHLKNPGFLQSIEEQLTEAEILELNHALEILSEILPRLK